MKTYKALQIKLAKKLSGEFLGSFLSAFSGHGMEFENLREYVPGDSVKKIDWKTTAKLGKPFVKNYEEERDINALFIFNLSENIGFGSREKTKLQTMQEVFYMLASAASAHGFRIGASLGDQYFDFSSGNKNIIRTLNYLDTLFPSGEGKYPQGDGMGKRKGSIKNIKNSLIFILSDKTEIGDLNVLARYNDVVYVNIFDSLEKTGTPDNFLAPISGMLSFFSSDKQAKYQDARTTKLTNFKNTLQKKQIRYMALDDSDDMFLSFYRFFTRAV